MEKCVNDDPTISSLLSMAETFLSQAPPTVPEAVRSLLAVLSLHPPPRIEARTRLQLGLTLFHHTNNLLEAREHLDKAALVAQSAANLEEVRFEATSVSVRILVEQQNFHGAKSLLRGRIEASSHYPHWHVRLLLQLADVSMSERDEGGVINALNKCAEYAGQVDAPYTRLLCCLCKGAVLLTYHRYQEAGEVLNHTSGLMENYHGDKETLIRTLYLIVQVSHLLVAGQVKAAKPHLKQLQQRVKTLSADPSLAQFPSVASSLDSRLLAENFQWLTREQTFVMVYLVSVMHSVQGGYTDKALSYAEKAMHLMPLDASKDCGVVSVLRAHLLEQIIQCLLMKGDTANSAEKIHQVLEVCHGHSGLIYAHRPVLHALLGLYAFATNHLDRAAVQFHTALQHTNSGELRMFVSLNLALTYMKLGEPRNTELGALMLSLESDSATAESCQSLRAALHYVRGLYSFTQLRLHEAKRHLRETLLMSNKCDLNRLTTCSLILLGQIFLSIGNTKETMDMVSPAMQLSLKIPDKKLQVWAASLLADLYHLTGDQEKEFSLRQQSATTADRIQADLSLAVQSKHHNLIQWTVGEWPISQGHQQQNPVDRALPPSQHPKLGSPSLPPKLGAPSLPPSLPSLPPSQHPKLGGKRKKMQGLESTVSDRHPGKIDQSSFSFDVNGAKALNERKINLQHDSPKSNSQPPILNSPTLKGSPVMKLKKPTQTPATQQFSSSIGLGSQGDSHQEDTEDLLNRDNPIAPGSVPSKSQSQPDMVSNHQDSLPQSPISLPPSYPGAYPHHHPHQSQRDHQRHQQHQNSPLTPPIPHHTAPLSLPHQQVHIYSQDQESTSRYLSIGDKGQHPAVRSPLNPAIAQRLSPQSGQVTAFNANRSPGSNSPGNSVLQPPNLSPSARGHSSMQQQQQPNQQLHNVRLKVDSPGNSVLQPPNQTPSPAHGLPFMQQQQPNQHSVRLKSLQRPSENTTSRQPPSEPSPPSRVPTPHHSHLLPQSATSSQPQLSPPPPLYLGSPHPGSVAQQYQQLQHQQQYMKTLEEERLKQTQQQQKLLDLQQNLQQVDKIMSHNSSSQKYFPAQDEQMHSFMQQQFHHQQQQQQQQQHAQIQQHQYLLQQAAGTLGYMQGNYLGVNPEPGLMGSKTSLQMPHLTHMMSHQREGSKPSSPGQMALRPTMMPIPGPQYPRPGFGQQQQQQTTMQLLPNGANLPPNPPYSPLRHFNMH